VAFRASQYAGELDMFRAIAPCVMVLVALVGCGKPAAKKKTGASAPPPPPGFRVTIDDAGIKFGDKQLTLPATKAQLVEILGEPDRTVMKVNDILVWDQRGIYAYSKKGGDEIHDISFAFRKQDYDFEPATQFTAPLDVAGMPISAATTADELKQAGFVYDLSHEKIVGGKSVIVDFDGGVLSLSYSLL
jgi:hypothetical protein